MNFQWNANSEFSFFNQQLPQPPIIIADIPCNKKNIRSHSVNCLGLIHLQKVLGGTINTGAVSEGCYNQNRKSVLKQAIAKLIKSLNLLGFFCRQQEEPTILICRLLLCMCGMYVAQHSFGLPVRMNATYRTQFDHVGLDLLSLIIWSRVFLLSIASKTYAKHSNGAKVFWPSFAVARTPY